MNINLYKCEFEKENIENFKFGDLFNGAQFCLTQPLSIIFWLNDIIGFNFGAFGVST